MKINTVVILWLLWYDFFSHDSKTCSYPSTYIFLIKCNECSYIKLILSTCNSWDTKEPQVQVRAALPGRPAPAFEKSLLMRLVERLCGTPAQKHKQIRTLSIYQSWKIKRLFEQGSDSDTGKSNVCLAMEVLFTLLQKHVLFFVWSQL